MSNKLNPRKAIVPKSNTPNLGQKLWKTYLKSSGQCWDDPGELADADDGLVRDVGDGGRAVEGQKVVLTDGEDVDVLDGDDLAIDRQMVIAIFGHVVVGLAWG